VATRLRLSGIGEIVGDFQPFASGKHCATAEPFEPAVAFVWQMATFERLLDGFPAFRRNTVRALEERTHELEQRFRELSTENVGPRLHSDLIRLSNRFVPNC
jgi:CRP-like cAMP-binding protein